MLYISGKSITKGDKVSLGNTTATPVLPLENLFLENVDGITKPFRIGPNLTGADRFNVRLYLEFEELEQKARHLALNDITVSESAIWSLWYYGASKCDKDWSVELTGDSDDILLYYPFMGGPSGSIDPQPGYIQLTNWAGEIYIDPDYVADYVIGDGRYWVSWIVENETGIPTYLPGPNVSVRQNGSKQILIRQTTQPDDWASYPFDHPKNQGLSLVIPDDGMGGGWTGKIYGFNVRKQTHLLAGTQSLEMIGNQELSEDLCAYRYSPIRGVNDIYPINAVHFLNGATEVQSVIISIIDNDPAMEFLDIHNVHIGSGMHTTTPPGLSYDPDFPKLESLENTGFSFPEEKPPIRNFVVPFKYLSIEEGIELSRIIASAVGKPIFISCHTELTGPIRQFWTMMGYVKSFDLKNNIMIWEGKLSVQETRVSFNP